MHPAKDRSDAYKVFKVIGVGVRGLADPNGKAPDRALPDLILAIGLIDTPVVRRASNKRVVIGAVFRYKSRNTSMKPRRVSWLGRCAQGHALVASLHKGEIVAEEPFVRVRIHSCIEIHRYEYVCLPKIFKGGAIIRRPISRDRPMGPHLHKRPEVIASNDGITLAGYGHVRLVGPLPGHRQVILAAAFLP